MNCRSCGAPADPGRCSYCLTPSVNVSARQGAQGGAMLHSGEYLWQGRPIRDVLVTNSKEADVILSMLQHGGIDRREACELLRPYIRAVIG